MASAAYTSKVLFAHSFGLNYGSEVSAELVEIRGDVDSIRKVSGKPAAL
jgi:hypothetical protein